MSDFHFFGGFQLVAARKFKPTSLIAEQELHDVAIAAAAGKHFSISRELREMVNFQQHCLKKKMTRHLNNGHVEQFKEMTLEKPGVGTSQLHHSP